MNTTENHQLHKHIVVCSALYDMNGVEIKAGMTVSYSSYTPNEKTEIRKVIVQEDGSLWAGEVPVQMLINHGYEYRKLTVVS